MKQLLESKIPKLIHFSITGLGGTEYEPGVMKPMDLLDKIGEYIQQGLDPDIITIRIDPIVPGVTTPRMIEEIIKKASSLGIKRIRFSIMDAYAHTVMEMSKLGYDFNANYGINPVTNQPYYNAKTEKINAIAEFMLKMKDKYNVTLGTCAEGLVREGISKEGCLSVTSVNKMLGTSIPDLDTENNKQRKLCSCYGGKIDALQYNNTCASHCIYCYAKHANDQAMHYYNEDGTLKDNNFTRTRQSQSTNTPNNSPIKWLKSSEKYSRESVKNDPDSLYIFTDNTDRTSGGALYGDGWYKDKYGEGGYGSSKNPTSAQIRGLENAVPISTMRYFYKLHNGMTHPRFDRNSEARWHDKDFEEFKKVFDDEIDQIIQLLSTGKYKRLVSPTGDQGKSPFFDSKLTEITKERTPKIYDYMMSRFKELQLFIEKQLNNSSDKDINLQNGQLSVKDDFKKKGEELMKQCGLK